MANTTVYSSTGMAEPSGSGSVPQEKPEGQNSAAPTATPVEGPSTLSLSSFVNRARAAAQRVGSAHPSPTSSTGTLSSPTYSATGATAAAKPHVSSPLATVQSHVQPAQPDHPSQPLQPQTVQATNELPTAQSRLEGPSPIQSDMPPESLARPTSDTAPGSNGLKVVMDWIEEAVASTRPISSSTSSPTEQRTAVDSASSHKAPQPSQGDQSTSSVLSAQSRPTGAPAAAERTPGTGPSSFAAPFPLPLPESDGRIHGDPTPTVATVPANESPSIATATPVQRTAPSWVTAPASKLPTPDVESTPAPLAPLLELAETVAAPDSGSFAPAESSDGNVAANSLPAFARQSGLLIPQSTAEDTATQPGQSAATKDAPTVAPESTITQIAAEPMISEETHVTASSAAAGEGSSNPIVVDDETEENMDGQPSSVSTAASTAPQPGFTNHISLWPLNTFCSPPVAHAPQMQSASLHPMQPRHGVFPAMQVTFNPGAQRSDANPTPLASATQASYHQPTTGRIAHNQREQQLAPTQEQRRQSAGAAPASDIYHLKLFDGSMVEVRKWVKDAIETYTDPASRPLVLQSKTNLDAFLDRLRHQFRSSRPRVDTGVPFPANQHSTQRPTAGPSTATAQHVKRSAQSPPQVPQNSAPSRDMFVKNRDIWKQQFQSQAFEAARSTFKDPEMVMPIIASVIEASGKSAASENGVFRTVYDSGKAAQLSEVVSNVAHFQAVATRHYNDLLAEKAKREAMQQYIATLDSNKQIAAAEREREQIARERDQHRRERDQLKLERDQARDECAQLKRERVAASKVYMNLYDQHAALQAKMEKTMDMGNAEAADLTANHTNAHATSPRETTPSREELDGLLEQIADQKARIDALTLERDRHVQEARDIKTQLLSALDERDRLNRLVEDHKFTDAALNAEIIQLKESRENLKSLLNTEVKQLKDEREDLKSLLNAEIRHLKNERDAHKVDCEMLKAAGTERDISRLDAKYRMQLKKVACNSKSELQSAIDELTSSHQKELQEAKDKAQARSSEDAVKLAKAGDRIKELEPAAKAVSETRAVLIKLETRIAQMVAETESRQSEFTTLRSDFEKLQQERNEALARVEELEARITSTDADDADRAKEFDKAATSLAEQLERKDQAIRSKVLELERKDLEIFHLAEAFDELVVTGLPAVFSVLKAAAPQSPSAKQGRTLEMAKRLNSKLLASAKQAMSHCQKLEQELQEERQKRLYVAERLRNVVQNPASTESAGSRPALSVVTSNPAKTKLPLAVSRKTPPVASQPATPRSSHKRAASTDGSSFGIPTPQRRKLDAGDDLSTNEWIEANVSRLLKRKDGIIACGVESKDRIKAGLDPDVPFDDKVVLSADKKEQIKHMTDNHVALLETFRKKQSVKAPEQK